MKNNLDKYTKKRSKRNHKVTSVNITFEQYEFLVEKNLSLSEIVRERIDQLMKHGR